MFPSPMLTTPIPMSPTLIPMFPIPIYPFPMFSSPLPNPPFPCCSPSSPHSPSQCPPHPQFPMFPFPIFPISMFPSLILIFPTKAEHESRSLTGTHELTHENTHHEPDPWIQIHSQWQIPKDLGLTFGEQNTHKYPPSVPLLTSQFNGNIWCKLLKLVMYC